jgi:hypothetical protein
VSRERSSKVRGLRDSMRAAVCPDTYPAIAQWTRWQQEQPSVTVLPSGEEFASDRGAEQGDTFGTAQSCLTLAAERVPAISAQTQPQLPVADGVSHVPCCEEWFPAIRRSRVGRVLGLPRRVPRGALKSRGLAFCSR